MRLPSLLLAGWLPVAVVGFQACGGGAFSEGAGGEGGGGGSGAQASGSGGESTGGSEAGGSGGDGGGDGGSGGDDGTGGSSTGADGGAAGTTMGTGGMPMGGTMSGGAPQGGMGGSVGGSQGGMGGAVGGAPQGGTGNGCEMRGALPTPDSPCAGRCERALPMGPPPWHSDNIGICAQCYEYRGELLGFTCNNFLGGRTLNVNGVYGCEGSSSGILPPVADAPAYCFQATAGEPEWASFDVWN